MGQTRWRSGAEAILRLRGNLCGGGPVDHRSGCMKAGEKPGDGKEKCKVGGDSAGHSVRLNLEKSLTKAFIADEDGWRLVLSLGPKEGAFLSLLWRFIVEYSMLSFY